jgi:hypothetical protein
MDRRIYVLMLLFFAGWHFSCSGSGYKEGPAQLTGVAVMVGNEPFTAISLQTSDGTSYRLDADSLMLMQFRENQGKEFRVTGTVRDAPMGPVLRVESFTKK